MCLAYRRARCWGCHALRQHGCCQHWRATFYWKGTDIVKQRMKLGHRASRTTGTLLKQLRVRVMVMVWPCMFPDPNPVNDLLCFLKQKVEKSNVSNTQHLRDVVMEEQNSKDSNGILWSFGELHGMPKSYPLAGKNGCKTKFYHFVLSVDLITFGCTHFCYQQLSDLLLCVELF